MTPAERARIEAAASAEAEKAAELTPEQEQRVRVLLYGPAIKDR
jgi:hypothetical protein